MSEIKTEDYSDGYHTFKELYEHRHALFITLLRCPDIRAWRSKLHEDGTMFEGGWFVAGFCTPTGAVSYHMPIELWEELDYGNNIKTFKYAPHWDGHTPGDVVKRLLEWRGI